MSDRDVLISMGFDSSRVDWALKATNNRGLQPAMDYILENEGNPVPDPAAAATSTPSSGTSSGGGGNDMDVDNEDEDDLAALKAVYGPAATSSSGETEPKSIKCSLCGKIFKNTALANYHAEKSGHDQFEESTEEIKPLTEEEKKQRLEELKSRLADKRVQKAVQDAKEAKANEAIRRKSGKDIGKLREELKVKESMNDAARKRQEKLDDARAKAKIKAQIEADKKERAEKAAREKALREGAVVPPPQEPPSSAAAAPKSAVSGKDFKETRLQIRVESEGKQYVTTLPSDATLLDVAEYLASQTLSVDVDTVNLAQHFPRKLFSRKDFSKTLRELGLTPSAVLLAS